jgi:long-chain acyl-CoA synthetase
MTDRQESLSRLDTFPKILLRNAETRSDAPAYREKDYGVWQSWNWRESADNVRALACGLAALGIKRGDKVAIIGDNRPHLYWAFPAVQCLGGVVVPIYQDSIAEEVVYVLDHAETRAAVVENQEQVDKLLSVKDQYPGLEFIIYSDPRGLGQYDEPFLYAYEQIQERGRAFDAENPEYFLDEVAKGSGSDLSIIAYTSGTTGRPKGVMLNFDALCHSATLSVEFESLGAADETLSYMPMAWVGDHFFSYAQAYTAGFTVNCPESPETVMLDLREIGPTYFFAPPRVFENILTQVMIRMEDASWIKRKIFAFFIGVARRVGVKVLEGGTVSLVDRLLYWLGSLLVYEPLKDNLGLRRVRVSYTAGAPLGTEVFDFFRSLGINLKQLYGQTESSAYVCIQTDGDVKAETVGPPAPGCEVKITEEGEVIYKSPGTFLGYYKNPEATAETLDAEGWVHTGDAGIIDDSGHLKLIDRAKDVGHLNDGTLFAPQYIENKLKFSPYISEAVAHGNGRDFVTAFINIDLEAVGNWAERHGLAYSSYTDLAGRDEVYDIVRDAIDQVNAGLAQDSALVGSQIKHFLLLHKELDADDGELTRTRKVRRRIVADRYDELIEALYSDRDSIEIEANVTYEDGRQAVIKADLKIREVPLHGLNERFEETEKAA